MGRDQSQKLARKPLLRQAYEEYIACRITQLVVFNKNLGDGKEKTVVVTWPTGFGNLPHDGGWQDQPYLTTRLLAAALRGDQQGTSRLMSKA